MLSENLLAADVPLQVPVTRKIAMTSTSQLLNWPEIIIKINIGEVIMVRTVRSNEQHELVFGNNSKVKYDMDTNYMKPRLLPENVDDPTKSNQKSSTASTSILFAYFDTLIQAAAIADVYKYRQNELRTIFERLKYDLKDLEILETNKRISIFCGPCKYMRNFDNDIGNTNDETKVVLRETINPEILISLEACKFDINHIHDWENFILKYTNDLLIDRDKVSLLNLNNMLCKSITISCIICNQDFDGELCIISVKKHLETHFNPTKWTCVRCGKSFSQLKLTGVDDWAHQCSEPNRTL